MATIVNKNSKTILDLLPGKDLGRSNVMEMALPVQRASSNYHLLVRDILELVNKALVGLENVDNTSDINKPISTAVNQALSSKAELEHMHGVQDIRGLAETLSRFFTINEQIPIENLRSVTRLLQDYADRDHNHDLNQILGLSDALQGKADVQHDHELSTLPGFQNLIDIINQGLGEKLNAEQVDQRIDRKLEVFSSQIDQLVGTDSVREIPGQW